MWKNCELLKERIYMEIHTQTQIIYSFSKIHAFSFALPYCVFTRIEFRYQIMRDGVVSIGPPAFLNFEEVWAINFEFGPNIKDQLQADTVVFQAQVRLGSATTMTRTSGPI